MRWRYALWAGLLAAGCTTKDFVPATQAPTVDKAPSELTASQTTLAQRPATYTYMRQGASFTGHSWETVVSVTDGVVTARDHRVWTWAGYGDRDIVEEWSENGGDVGTHEGAFPAHTLPQLYEQCRTEILTLDAETHDIGFALFEDGVLARCTAWPKGCQDDCLLGVSITRIDFGP